MMIGEGLQNKKVQGPSEFWTALTVNICEQDWELANDSKSCKTSGDTVLWEALQSPLELSLEAGTRKNHTGEGDRAAG